jgi:hypothetical protein
MEMTTQSSDSLVLRFEQRFLKVSYEATKIKASFDRLRAQMAQTAEQKSRPAARIYGNIRAIKP